MHQKYVSDTAKKTDDHTKYFEDNKKITIEIDKSMRSIANKKAKIDLWKLKIL